ncbi:MAG: ABC transporter substrate-binding protein, partial [Ezakiella sp.]
EKFPQFQTAIDQLHDSTPESQGAICAVYQESRQVFEKYVEDMLNGVKTPKEAAEAMQKDIDSAINDYNRANKK